MPHVLGHIAPGEISDRAAQVDESSWHLAALGIDSPIAGVTGKNVTVAVLDSGIADVRGLRLHSSFSYRGNEIDPGDLTGHGTRCASLIASTSAGALGIAPDVTLVSIRVVRSDGRVRPRELLPALKMAREIGADVISCSFVVPDVSNQVEIAVRDLLMEGRVVVAAAGNRASARNAFPERVSHVISVSGVGRDESPLADARGGRFVDVAAPGEQLRVLTERDGRVTDTFGDSSGAAAVVSGCCALALSVARRGEKRVRLGAALEGLLRLSAKKLPHPPERVGFGLIDPVHLIRRARELVST